LVACAISIYTFVYYYWYFYVDEYPRPPLEKVVSEAESQILAPSTFKKGGAKTFHLP
jgi:hypothetical protein